MTAPGGAVTAAAARRAAADAWAREHGCRDILHCCMTPLQAFAAGAAAERDRICELADEFGARIEHGVTVGVAYTRFSDLIRAEP